MIQPSRFLRRAIQADAVVTGAVALLQTFGAGLLAPMLNLPQPLVIETGLFLVAYTALVGWLGTRQSMPRALVAVVIAGNAAWALGSIALMFSGWVSPNALGYAFIAVHAKPPAGNSCSHTTLPDAESNARIFRSNVPSTSEMSINSVFSSMTSSVAVRACHASPSITPRSP